MLWATLGQIPPQKLHNNLNMSEGHSVLSPLLRAPQRLPSAAAGRQQKQNVFLPSLQHSLCLQHVVSFRNRAHLHHSNQTVTYLLQQARMASTSETEQPKPTMTIPKAISLIKHKHSVSVLVDVRWLTKICTTLCLLLITIDMYILHIHT